MSTTAAEGPAPSVWAIAFATALLSGLAGYFVGQASSIGIFAKSPTQAQAPVDKPSNGSDEDEGEDSTGDNSDDDDLNEQELKSFADRNEECKLVLVVRTDLGMTKGTNEALSG